MSWSILVGASEGVSVGASLGSVVGNREGAGLGTLVATGKVGSPVVIATGTGVVPGIRVAATVGMGVGRLVPAAVLEVPCSAPTELVLLPVPLSDPEPNTIPTIPPMTTHRTPTTTTMELHRGRRCLPSDLMGIIPSIGTLPTSLSKAGYDISLLSSYQQQCEY